MRSRCPYCQGDDDMKRLTQILGSLILITILFLAGAMLYSTLKGYTTWYFPVNGQVTTDGRETGGYMHANPQRTLLLLTRTDGSRPETYLVSLRDDKGILDCGGFHPTRFFPIPIGDVNPPCSAFTVDPAKIIDAPLSMTLVRGQRSVEFSTVSSKKVKAEW
jgi:hypothetical protein